MLPITKTIEKCMLPVGTRPVIDYVVQDVIKAGITDIYFVVSEQSTQLQSYYSENTLLSDYLMRAGKEDKLPLIQPPKNIRMHYIVQPSYGGYGTSVPVGIASDVIPDGESAVVIMGDQFFLREDEGSNVADLIELARQSDLDAALYGVRVSWDDIEKGGAIETDRDGNFVRIVEKPKREDAPSNLNNASFYLFNKTIFDLAKTLPANPKRGEFEITDAINEYVQSGGKIVVGETKGTYVDCGTPYAWLAANNTVANLK